MRQTPLWKTVLILLVCGWGIFAALPNAFYARVEAHNDALLSLSKGADPQSVSAQALAAWPSWMPSSLVNLGLDLRGGVHLLAEVQLDDVYKTRIDGVWVQARDMLREIQDKTGGLRRQPSDDPAVLRIRLTNADAIPEALKLLDDLGGTVVSLTGLTERDILVQVQGGDIVVTLSEAEKQALSDRTIAQALEIVRRRVDEVGTREPTIQRQGKDRILIQVPGIGSAAELKALIGTTAKLTFNPVVRRTTNPEEHPGIGNALVPSLEDSTLFYVLEDIPVVTGQELVDAQPSFDQNNRPAVSFRFDPAGARLFGDYTADHIGEPFAIVLDNQVISAPVIQSHIAGGSGIITGSFTVEEATQLAVLLRAGALPAKLTFLEERTVGPELGQDSIESGRLAAMVGLIAVLVFMILSYGVFGVFSSLALVINITLLFAALSSIGATLTLPGIAGIVLTIGMAVDANVLVFERIREELETTKNPGRAISLGYERALSAIIDANITTFITALVLFMAGSGAVRGFAVTLGLGIVTSVFTALFVTRLMIELWFPRRRSKNLIV